MDSDKSVELVGQVLKADAGYYHLTGHPAGLRVLRDLALEPTGPFYNFVLTYLVASAGLTPVYDATGNPNFMDRVAGVFPGTVRGDLRANLAECVRWARDGTLPQQRAEQALCCMLANSAYESLTKADRDRLKGDPVFEVFRHVRHAASHGNHWHFLVNEPTRYGEWHHIKIDHTLKGDDNPLQGETCFYGTLQPADLLYLLGDVEALLHGQQP